MYDKEICVFNCEVCGKESEIEVDTTCSPECCGQPMKEKPAEALPVCEVSTTAEHARFDDFGEPCDDGRAGKP